MYTNNYDGKQYYPKLNIELEPGVYVFRPISASGKTFIHHTLKDVARKYDTVAYTYDDYLDGISLEHRISRCSGIPKVIMLDRYDMYIGKCDDIIEKYENKSIILLDIKDTNEATKRADDFVYIELSNESIRVYRV